MNSPPMSPPLSGRMSPRASPDRSQPVIPLPASAVEYWIEDQGVELASAALAQSWRGQLRGTLVEATSAPNRATYDRDTGYFAGRKVMQFSGGKSLWTPTALATPLTAASTKPSWYIVTRPRSTATPQCAVAFFDSLPTAASYAAGSLQEFAATGTVWRSWWFPLAGLDVASPTVDTANVIRIESGINSAGAIVVRFNGSVVATQGSGQVSPGACRAVQFGSDRGASPFNGCIAFVLLCSAEMTAAERAALDAWAVERYVSPQ